MRRKEEAGVVTGLCLKTLHHRTAKDGLDPREVPLGIPGLLEKAVCTSIEKFGFYFVPSENSADKHRDGRRVRGEA
jgi:hypothetical protein